MSPPVSDKDGRGITARHPGNCHQPGEGRFERADVLVDRRRQLLDRFFEKFDLAQDLREQERVMRPKAALERLAQGW